MAPRHSSLLAIALVALLRASPVGAAEGPPDPTTEEGKRVEGKERFERGAEAYSAGRFKDAIDLFLQADALAPSAALSFNIARAYEKIGDEAAALQWYRDFRRRAPEAKNGAEVDDRIRTLEGALAKKGVQQVTILSRPLGATVTIDDRPVGVTPFTTQLPPGSHQVLLSLRGYAESAQPLELPADHAQLLEIPLLPALPAPAVPPAGASVAAPSAATTPPGTSSPPPPPPRANAAGPRFGVWPWVGLGAGALALSGSLGFELARRAAVDAAKEDPTQVGYKDALDRAEGRQTTARVLAGVGGALVVSSGILLVIRLTSGNQGEPRASASLGLQGSAWGVNLGGKF